MFTLIGKVASMNALKRLRLRKKLAFITLFLLTLQPIFGQRTTAIGSAQTFDSGATWEPKLEPIDDTHVLAVWKAGGSATANPLMARVGQVDTANKTITWGTASTIESGAFRYGSVLVLNGTTAVIAFEVDAASDYGAAKVITFSTATDAITAIGSSTTFQVGDVDASFSFDPIHMNKLTGTTLALTFVDEADNGTVMIGTVSGTTISFGGQYEFNTNDVQNHWVTTLAPDKLFITWEDDGGTDQGMAVVGTISGTTVSFGSTVTFESSPVIWTTCQAISSTQAIIGYTLDDANDYGYSKVATIAGTSITLEQFYFYSVETGVDTVRLGIGLSPFRIHYRF
ncbi:MAG: hypothetical protein R2813_10225 [Flavobacteriales bacterium]